MSACAELVGSAVQRGGLREGGVSKVQPAGSSVTFRSHPVSDLLLHGPEHDSQHKRKLTCCPASLD